MNLGKKSVVIIGFALALALIYCSLLILFGIVSFKGGRSDLTPDSWINLPDQSAVTLPWKRLEDRCVHDWIPGFSAQAEGALADVWVTELTDEQYESYTGTKWECTGKAKAYLIRGVQLAGGSGHFEVYLHERALWVRYGCLAKTPGRLVRHPIIVELEEKPAVILVDVLTAS